ncbi:MAG: acyl-CoA thioesterase [Tissierellia bacterium]|nr:acyl-CoA thioesterase [Tissierellia bacterium]
MVNSTLIRVRYKDTDQMGVVYNGNYFNWFEIGRVELLREMGISYKDLEKRGVFTAVSEAYCKYIKPARFDDEIIIKTRIIKLTETRVEFEYSLHRKEDNQLLAKGHTIHVFVDRNIKPISLKDTHKDLWELFEGQAKDNE